MGVARKCYTLGKIKINLPHIKLSKCNNITESIVPELHCKTQHKRRLSIILRD